MKCFNNSFTVVNSNFLLKQYWIWHQVHDKNAFFSSYQYLLKINCFVCTFEIEWIMLFFFSVDRFQLIQQ